MYFCANPKCRFHFKSNLRVFYYNEKLGNTEIDFSKEKQISPEDIILDNMKRIMNHLFYSRNRVAIFICDECKDTLAFFRATLKDEI
jgi:hypothetical protein